MSSSCFRRSWPHTAPTPNCIYCPSSRVITKSRHCHPHQPDQRGHPKERDPKEAETTVAYGKTAHLESASMKISTLNTSV